MSTNTYHLIRLVELTRDINAAMTTIDQARDAGNRMLAKRVTERMTNEYSARAQVILNAIQDGAPVEALMFITQQATEQQLMRLITDGPLTEDSVMLMAIQAQINDQRDNAMIDAVEATHGLKSSKPKARKAFTPKLGVNYQDTVSYLRSAKSREDAAVTLKGFTIPELRHIANLMGHKLIGKVKADMLTNLVDATVGWRLDSNAIMNAAQSY